MAHALGLPFSSIFLPCPLNDTPYGLTGGHILAHTHCLAVLYVIFVVVLLF